MAAESKDNYYTKTQADDEFVSSNEGAEIQNRLDVILEQTPVQDIDTLSLETTETKTGVWYGGIHSEGTTAGWKYYIINNDGYTTLDVDVFSGNSSTNNPYCIYFYSDRYIFDDTTYISGAIPCTKAGDEKKEIITIPEHTKAIIVNHRTSSGDISVFASGYQESGRIVDIENEIDSILNSEEKVKDGLVIAVVDSSNSTKINRDAYEITITEQDVGVPLAAYLTYYDYYGLSGSTPVGLTIGGHTFTADEIGKQVYFTPLAEDVGKSLGLALRYAGNDDKKVWWEYLEDLGATVIPVCWSGASLTAHEESNLIRKTSHSWHDAQIRKLGVRIPGSMQRRAPDIIIMIRGLNDMTHAPYSLLTDGYFDNMDWSYPTTDEVTGGWGIKEGLSLWIKKVRDAYPFSKICIATQRSIKRINCSKFPINNGLYSLPQLNNALREAANFFGCHTIDLDRNGMTFENIYPYYVDDSSTIPTHTNNNGHKAIARQAIIDLKSKLDFIHLDHDGRESSLKMNVVYNLSNVTSTNNETIATLGEAYTTTLSPIENTTVVIRQNNADITSSAYNVSTGVVTISSVNGDIEIEASSSVTSYNIVNTLTNVTNSNNSSTIPEHNIYSAELISDAGYIKDSVTVTMGGADITSSVYSDGFISIPSVTGDIEITATATATIGGSYQIHNAQTGILNGAAPTQLNKSDLSKSITKFQTTTNISSGKGYALGGIYGKIFTATQSISDHIEFGTGSGGNTGVIPQANTKYISVCSNINQATSTLTIYAGNDESLTTPLGSGSRTATVSYPYSLYGSYSTSNQNYNTNFKLIETKLYDTSNNLIRDYVPATRLSDSVLGAYDKLTGEFVPIVVDQ